MPIAQARLGSINRDENRAASLAVPNESFNISRPATPAFPEDIVPIRITALDHLVINVADVARAAQWYQRIIGMEVRVFDPGGGKAPRTSLVFGDQKINLRPADADQASWFTAERIAAGSDDLCFLTTATPDLVVAHLGAAGVAVEQGPVEKQGARGTLRSVYCRDPDGNLIEIASYATTSG